MLKSYFYALNFEERGMIPMLKFKLHVAVTFLCAVLFYCCAGKDQGLGYSVSKHTINVEFDVERNSLNVIDTLTLTYSKSCKSLFFILNENLNVQSVKAGEQEFDFSLMPGSRIYEIMAGKVYQDTSRYTKAQLLKIDLTKTLYPTKLSIRYSGALFDSTQNAHFSHVKIANLPTSVIGQEGIYLGSESYWYPFVPEEVSEYSVRAVTPKPFEVVSQGVLKERKVENELIYTWYEETHPIPIFTLSAGNYQVDTKQEGDIKINTYFYPQSRHLSQKYLEAGAHYVREYSELFGPYPYKQLSITENFFPVGLSMPSYILLGSNVLRLPFIVDSSLPHMICSSWWGNGVFVDYARGNWADGLVTYCADYYKQELEDAVAAREYRYEMLKEYKSFASQKNKQRLSEFIYRTTTVSRVIGYDKAAMVFHQLRKMVGDSIFFNALKSFYTEHCYRLASWHDLQRCFEKNSDTNLNWFFSQWLDQSGAPLINIGDVQWKEIDGGVSVDIKILQATDDFKLLVPITIKTVNAEINKSVWVNGLSGSLSLVCDEKPELIILDPDYDLFRELLPWEIMPSFGTVIGDVSRKVVLPTGTTPEIRSAYEVLARKLVPNPSAMIDDTVATMDDVGTCSLFILGGPEENSLYGWASSNLSEEIQVTTANIKLNNKNFDSDRIVGMFAIDHPTDLTRSVVLITGKNIESISLCDSKIEYYSNCGYFVFNRSKVFEQGKWPHYGLAKFHVQEPL